MSPSNRLPGEQDVVLVSMICNSSLALCSLAHVPTYGLVTYQGSGTPIVSNGRPSRNLFHNNKISNIKFGMNIHDGDFNQIHGKEKSALK